jgi:hypothetical protein
MFLLVTPQVRKAEELTGLKRDINPPSETGLEDHESEA